MPPLPKRNPARRNKSTTKATLSLVHSVKAPALPTHREWHPQTLQWWADIWASPMAPEYHDSDRHGLFSLAMLEDDFWRAESPTERTRLAAEIRLQRQCFGLTPMDRRRLQWEIERGEEAQDKGRARREAAAPKGPRKADPRAAVLG